MAKGKYAVRTANREASRDNDLLREKLAEIADLNTELGKLAQLLDNERRQRSALILERAHELAEQQILAHDKELNEYRAAQERDGFLLAKTMALAPKRKLMDVFLDGILPLLVKDQVKRSQIVDLWIEKGYGANEV